MITATRILVIDRYGFYLRWYYNGWHHWVFYAGTVVKSAQGQNYRTLSHQQVLLSSGQVTGEQINAIRTILNTTEVYLYTDSGWMLSRVLPGTSPIENSIDDGYELSITLIKGSRLISDTGLSPVEVVETMTYDDDHIYIIIGGTDITIILTGDGEVTIDWGDGTTETITLVDGEPQEITHTYTDGEDEHTVIVSDPDVIDVIDLTDQDVHDLIIPDEYADDIVVIVDPSDFTACSVIIGDQVWDCKNYDSAFPNSKVYNDDEDNRDIYGGLYTSNQIKNNGFCPAGKKVPTTADMDKLIEYCGGLTVTGGELKESGVTHWNTPNSGAVDTYGFAALGGGAYLYYQGYVITDPPEVPGVDYSDLKNYGHFIAKSETDDFYIYTFSYDGITVIKRAIVGRNRFVTNPFTNLFGFSVRLLRNFVYSQTITDYDGNVYHVAFIGTQKWLIENLKTTHYNDGTAIPNLTDSGDWMQGYGDTYNDWFLPSKDELTAMYDNLYAEGVGGFKEHGNYYSSSEYAASPAVFVEFIRFESPIVYAQGGKDDILRVRACRSFVAAVGVYSLRDIGPAGGLIFHIDGTNYYEAAPFDSSNNAWSNILLTKVGTSTAIGTGQANTTAIINQAGHTSSAAKLCDDLTVGGNISDGAMCWYNNDDAWKFPYGALYNWYAVDNAHGLAPTGCHIPTEAEWDTLAAFLDSNVGGKLKEAGISHWRTPNTDATNSSNFKAIGAANRSGSTGNFGTFHNSAWFWNATEIDSSTAYSKALSHLSGQLVTYTANGKNYGFSVRCIVE